MSSTDDPVVRRVAAEAAIVAIDVEIKAMFPDCDGTINTSLLGATWVWLERGGNLVADGSPHQTQINDVYSLAVDAMGTYYAARCEWDGMLYILRTANRKSL